MKKTIIFLLCVLLCLAGNADALSFDDIRQGMSYQEVLSVLRSNGMEFEEKEFEKSRSIIVKSDEYSINIGFKKVDDKASTLLFRKLGKKASSIDLFIPDWSLNIPGVISKLEKEGVGYRYQPTQRYFANQNGKMTRLEQPESIYEVEFDGRLDFIPVHYSLVFSNEGSLVEVEMSPTDENNVSNYLTMLAYLVKTIGMPLEAITESSSTFSSTEGGASIDDSCYWKYEGAHYEMGIGALVEKSVDNETEGSLYLNGSLVITPMEE